MITLKFILLRSRYLQHRDWRSRRGVRQTPVSMPYREWPLRRRADPWIPTELFNTWSCLVAGCWQCDLGMDRQVLQLENAARVHWGCHCVSLHSSCRSKSQHDHFRDQTRWVPGNTQFEKISSRSMMSLSSQQFLSNKNLTRKYRKVSSSDFDELLICCNLNQNKISHIFLRAYTHF